MKRTMIAVAWIFGTTVPVTMAAVFLIGCCVLPFHGVIHKLMPLCEMAASVIRGDHGDDHHDNDVTPPPSRQKADPVKRFLTALPHLFPLALATTTSHQFATPSPETSHRSFISLGAVRCDQDVGLLVFVQTFRI